MLPCHWATVTRDTVLLPYHYRYGSSSRCLEKAKPVRSHPQPVQQPFPTSHIFDSKLRICGNLAAVTAGCCRKPELISLYSRRRCCFEPKIRCVQCQSEKRCCPPSLRSAGQSLPDCVEQCRFSNLAGWAFGSPVTAAGLHGTRQIYHFAMAGSRARCRLPWKHPAFRRV